MFERFATYLESLDLRVDTKISKWVVEWEVKYKVFGRFILFVDYPEVICFPSGSNHRQTKGRE